MARIAIVGGHGKIALELSKQLSRNGDTPVGLIRNPDHASDLERVGAESAIVDIENADVAEFARAFEGADAVVFAAGAGGDGKIERKQSVDLGGSVKSVAAASDAGVTRFVQISAIGVDRPIAEDTEPVWKAYVEAKRDADINLRDSDLNWTIVRPGALIDDPATGDITLGDEVERGSIPRKDVAAVIVAVLAEPKTFGKQWEVVSGTTPIDQAIAANI